MSESATMGRPRPSRPSRLDEQEAKRDESKPETDSAASKVDAASTEATSTEGKPETQQPVPGGPEVVIDGEDGEVEVSLEDVMSRSSKFSKHFARIDAARDATKRGKAKQTKVDSEDAAKTLAEEMRGAAYAKGYGFRAKPIKIAGQWFLQYAVPDKREKKTGDS